jgi:hypothetical protein
MKAMKILLGAMMVFMVLGGMALALPASTSGTSTVNANLGGYLKVTVPSALTMNLVPGPDDSNAVSSSVTIDSNQAWSLDVGTTLTISGKDWHGKLWSPTVLFGIANNLGMDVGANEFLLDDIPGTGHNMATGSAGSNTVNFDLEQQVLLSDKPASDYSAVIEFDATSI